MMKEIKIDSIKLTCIDDSCKPEEIKSSNWIKKNKDYTLVKILKNPIQNQRFVVLEEVQPDKPYGGYKIERFGLSQETILQIENAINKGELIEEVI